METWNRIVMKGPRSQPKLKLTATTVCFKLVPPTQINHETENSVIHYWHQKKLVLASITAQNELQHKCSVLNQFRMYSYRSLAAIWTPKNGFHFNHNHTHQLAEQVLATIIFAPEVHDSRNLIKGWTGHQIFGDLWPQAASLLSLIALRPPIMTI